MAFETARWIEYKGLDAPKFKKTFNVKNLHNARLAICGLGFFEAEINGKRVSCDVLVPAWSNYEPRVNRRILYPINDTMTHRIYYMEYDVTQLLKEGENELTVLLGNGWYNQRCRNAEGDLWYGDLKLCFDLCVNDSTNIVSDESVLVSESQVVFNNIYYGEKQNFNIKENYNKKASCVDAPQGILEKQTCPADKVHRIITPVKIKSFDKKDIYDCGENTTGWVIFTQPLGGRGETTVRYAEEIDSSFNLDFTSAGGDNQIQTDTYISSGRKNICRPKFTWHGFRYFEIEGEYENLQVEVVYADVEITADFWCNDEVINGLFQNYIRSQVTNMHCGVPSDCPHRERLGYTGDGQLTCDTAMHMLECKEFYRKWMRDIADCQDVKSGHIQHSAPFYGGGGGPGGWGSAIVAVPYFYYKNYFEIDVLTEYYPNMKKWCNYMDSRLESGLVVREEKDGWCIGEWGLTEKILLPEPYINTYFYIKSLMYMREIAEILRKDEDWICSKIEFLKDAVRRQYYNEEANCVLEGVQGAEAFFCDLGMGNAEMLRRLNNKYKKMGFFDTGIFGTDVLVRVLFENGYSDTAVKLLSSRKKDTFGYQILECNATTLWEYWNGEQSHNHPMFGACVKYLFTELLGMKKGTTFRIEPKPSVLLNNVRGKIREKGKEVSVEYEIVNDKIIFKIWTGIPLIFSWDGKEYKLTENTNCVYSFNFEFVV